MGNNPSACDGNICGLAISNGGPCVLNLLYQRIAHCMSGKSQNDYWWKLSLTGKASKPYTAGSMKENLMLSLSTVCAQCFHFFGGGHRKSWIAVKVNDNPPDEANESVIRKDTERGKEGCCGEESWPNSVQMAAHFAVHCNEDWGWVRSVITTTAQAFETSISPHFLSMLLLSFAGPLRSVWVVYTGRFTPIVHRSSWQSSRLK